MCRMKSMILLKDSVFCPDYNGHSDMLGVLKIKDNKRVPDFVKIEIVPPNDDMTTAVSEWRYEPDQDEFPAWYVREVDEPRCRAALEKWANEHIIKSGERTVNKGVYYAYGSATVTARDSSTVTALGSSTVTARGSSTVTALGSSTVTAYDRSTVTAWDSSTVTALGSSTVTAYDRSTVTALGSSTVTARDSSTVTARDSSTVTALGSSTVTARGSSTVKELHDRAVAIKRESHFSKPVVEIAGEDTLRGPQKGKE